MGFDEGSPDQETDPAMKDADRFRQAAERNSRRAGSGNGCFAFILLAVIVFLTIVLVARCAGGS